MRYYLKDEVLLFDMDSILGEKNIPAKYHKLVTDVLVAQNLINI